MVWNGLFSGENRGLCNTGAFEFFNISVLFGEGSNAFYLELEERRAERGSSSTSCQ